MKAYLIFSLKNIINLVNAESSNIKKSNTLIITDKITIYNYLKKKKFKKIECLDGYFLGNERKKNFIKFYKYFDRLLKKIGKNNKITINKTSLNSVYNTFSCDLPRLYAGTKFILISLDKVLKKNKVKELIYLNDLENEYLGKIFYEKVFKYYSKEKKIKFTIKSLKKSKILDLISSIYRKIYELIFLYQEFNLKLLLIKIKKKISKINFLNNKTKIVFEPACDINFMNFKTNEVTFLDLTKKFTKILESTESKNENFNNNDFKNLNDIFIKYIVYKNLLMRQYYQEAYGFLMKKINFNKVKKIFWGSSPSYLIRNLIILLKKKYKVFGVQHGGSYFLTQKDSLHKDSDYFFCDEFFSYGSSKKFNKKKYLPKTKLLESGCFKEPYISEILKNKKSNYQNLLYVPLNLSNFFKPDFQSSQTERFKDQVQICNILNKQKYYNSYVKVLPNTFFKKLIFNYYNLEVNPICYEISDYKNLAINSNTVTTAMKKIKPRIILCDHLSTPAYELANSDSEIILILDKINYPKEDVLRVLKKRFFIIHSPKEIYSIIEKIYFKKIEKRHNGFYRFFYKKKLDYRI